MFSKKKSLILVPALVAALLAGCGKTAEPAEALPEAAVTEAPPAETLTPTQPELPSAPTEIPAEKKGSVTRFEDSIDWDLNDDGTAETISLAPVSDEGYFEKLTVTVGDNSCEQECWGYERTGYLVETAEGGRFLYAEVRTDNDYVMIEVFRLSADGAEYAGGFSGCFAEEPTDPAMLKLGSRMALLSTYGAEGLYAVDSYGEPQMIEPYLSIHNDLVLTILEELSCDIVDEQGTVLEQRTLPVGTELVFVRTDGKKIVDMRLPSGELCRMNVSSEWPQTVNGMDTKTVLGGMRFAG